MVKISYLLLFFLLLAQPNIAFSQQDVFAIAREGTLVDLNRLLLVSPGVINTVNEEGNSPLIIACYKGNADVAAYLIKNVQDINYTSKMGTALMAATVKNNLSLVKMLLQSKANPNINDANGTTALHYAVIFKFYEITEELMAYQADVDLIDIRKNTALDYAVLANDDKLIQILKSKKL